MKKSLFSNDLDCPIHKKGGFFVNISGINFGMFDQMDPGGLFCYFPRRQDEMTGDHYVAIGLDLNDINKEFKND